MTFTQAVRTLKDRVGCFHHHGCQSQQLPPKYLLSVQSAGDSLTLHWPQKVVDHACVSRFMCEGCVSCVYGCVAEAKSWATLTRCGEL